MFEFKVNDKVVCDNGIRSVFESVYGTILAFSKNNLAVVKFDDGELLTIEQSKLKHLSLEDEFSKEQIDMSEHLKSALKSISLAKDTKATFHTTLINDIESIRSSLNTMFYNNFSSDEESSSSFDDETNYSFSNNESTCSED